MRLRVHQEQSRMDAKGSWDTREASTDKFLAWTSGAQESSENTHKRNYGCWHLALTLNFAHGICLLGMQPNPPLYSLKTSRHIITPTLTLPTWFAMHCYVIVLIPLYGHIITSYVYIPRKTCCGSLKLHVMCKQFLRSSNRFLRILQ